MEETVMDMDNVSNMLKEARLAKGLSLEDAEVSVNFTLRR